MTASKSLPDRPSLESLRKQAKTLARDRSTSLRDAQLALAREYGYAGWQDLTAEVSRRLGNGLEWAAAQARRVDVAPVVETVDRLLDAGLHHRADTGLAVHHPRDRGESHAGEGGDVVHRRGPCV